MKLQSIVPPDLALQINDTIVSVLGGILLLLIAGAVAFLGWLLATLLARAAQFLLSHMGVDPAAERLAPGQVRRPEIYPSRVMAFALFWTVFLSACIIALRIVGLDLGPSIAARLQDLVPRILTSATVLVLGIPLAIAAGRILNALLAPSGLRPNRIRSQLVSALLIGFVVLLALEQLGLAAQLVIAIGITVVAAAGLALALAFGLGCRDLARDLIVEYLRASEEAPPNRRP